MSQSRKKNKVTTAHKVTLGALSVLGVVAGWNVVGRVEQKSESSAAQTEPIAPVATLPPVARNIPTPWPTIAPVAERPRLDVSPLPTLAASFAPDVAAGTGNAEISAASLSAPSLVAMPTLAPLPAMPEYVAPPPPPPRPPSQVAAAPPPPANNGGGNTSGGS